MYKAIRLLLPALALLVTSFSSLHAQGRTYEVDFATIQFVNVELDDNCQRETIYEIFLNGDADVDGDGIEPPQEAFIITIEDDMPANGNVVDGCGTYRFTVVPNPDSMVVGFTFGSGMITARDATAPRQVGPATALGRTFLTTDLDALTINTLPNTVSRTYTTDGTTTIPVDFDMALINRIMAGGSVVRFGDACSDVEVMVADNIIRGGDCDDIIIRRTFTAMDESLECSGTAFPQMQTIVSYDIVLERPSVDDLMDPVELVTYSCDDPDVAPGELPNPRTGEFPFFERDGGDRVFVDGVFGNVAVSFTNSAPVEICNNTIKYVRTYTAIDWCNTDNVRTFSQLVKVGDAAPPTINAPFQDNDFNGLPDDGPMVFSTNAPECGAFLTTQMSGLRVTDGCSSATTTTAFVVVNEDEDNVLGPIDVNAADPRARLTPFLPLGMHIIRYVATDDCGNESTLDVPVVIEDRSGPVVVAEDALNVALSSTGFATITAEDVDNGSYDDCTGVTLSIAFANASSLMAIGSFGPSITLSCVDVGAVPVILKVTDENGNENTRMSIINVVDNSAPVCIAPGNLVISCFEAEDMLPENLMLEFEANPGRVTNLLDDLFGQPTSLDNCANELVSQTITSTINDCGVGMISRTFTVTDGRGFTSAGGCEQDIMIRGVRDYTIAFPGDAAATCGNSPAYGDVSVTSAGCDMVVSHVQLDTFFASSDACFKLRRTIEIINWCEYDGSSPFYTISRDPDRNGDPTEDVYVHVIPNDPTTLEDDVAIIDRDSIRDNNNNITFVDADDLVGGEFDGNNDGDTGYGDSRSRGAFRYVQFVKITDNTAPVISNVSTDVTPSQNCDGGSVELFFRLMDGCMGADLTARVDIDLDYLPGEVFTVTRTISPNEIDRDEADYNVGVEEVPAGQHAFRIQTNDGCGNTSEEIVAFDVADESTIMPICAGRLTFVLANDGAGGGTAMVEADDYVVSTTGNCNNSGLRFSIYKIEGETDQPGFTPRPGRTSFPVSCEDVGEIPVRTYVFADNGNFTSCNGTAVIVASNGVNCAPPNLASISGFVVSPQNQLLRDIPVRIVNAREDDMMYTDANGSFLFTSLEMGEDYMVKPEEEGLVNFANVKTSDIAAIGRHALGLNVITDPFRLLAADANGDGYVDITDMLAIRRVILGIDETFAGGPTWRFVRRDFTLDGLTEGWDPEMLPGEFRVEDLDGHNRDADFIGVEIGDVFTEAAGREAVALTAEDRTLTTGESFDLTLNAGDLAGFQGTLTAAAGLVIEGWSSDFLGAGNVNERYLDRGQLAVSYDGTESLAGLPVLTLHLRAVAQLQISNYLRLDDQVTYREAILAGGRSTSFGLTYTEPTGGADIVLHQNFPNPVAGHTTIEFDLPAAGQAQLSVFDVQGRLLTQRTLAATAGRNTVSLSTNDDLKNTTGILTYTLTVGQERLSKRMTVIAR